MRPRLLARITPDRARQPRTPHRVGLPKASHRVGAPTADAGVDLVEHERRRLVGGRQDLLDRERDPAQLATRGDPAQRPGGLARVRCEPEDDLVDAGRVERDGVAVDFDRRFVRAGRAAAEGDLEDIARKAERLERAADTPRKRLADEPPAPGELRGVAIYILQLIII